MLKAIRLVVTILLVMVAGWIRETILPGYNNGDDEFYKYRILSTTLFMLASLIMPTIFGKQRKKQLFGNEKDVVQEVPEDQQVVFEDLMAFLEIEPPYYRGVYDTIWLDGLEDWKRECTRPSDELIRMFPDYKAIRFSPQLPVESYAYLDVSYKKYIAYDCTDGGTVFFFINRNHRIIGGLWLHKRCTPEEFEAVQIGMTYAEVVGKIDPNTDIDVRSGAGIMNSWHWLSDDTFGKIEYYGDHSDNVVGKINHYKSYEEAWTNGMTYSKFTLVNPADMPD